MKITKIRIKNYRSCNETVFELNESLSALIGPNGSGKTNILSAIQLISSLTRNRRRHLNNEYSDETPCEIKTWYDIEGKQIIHTAKILLVTNEKNQDEIINSSESWYMYSITGSKKRIKIPIEIYADLFLDRKFFHPSESRFRNRFLNAHLFESEELNEDVLKVTKKIVKFIEGISYYSASQFTNPSSCPISFEVEGDEAFESDVYES